LGKFQGTVADEKDYHILGLIPGCSKEEITEKWRKLVKKHHPDAGGKSEEFIKVQKAYESLVKKYD